MKALFVIVLGGENPAQLLASLEFLVTRDRKPEDVDVPQYISKERLQVAECLLSHQEDYHFHPKQAELLYYWAVTEQINELVGHCTNQKVECPVDGIPGSGQWLAGDRGGAYRILRDAVLRRGRFSVDQVRALERAYDLLNPWEWRRLIKAAKERRESK